MLGYELYSSALADMLSEPSLSMPITVGLYAKWGSGKSFLLSKLRGIFRFQSFLFCSSRHSYFSLADEMKGFARQWIEPQLNFSFILFVVLVHLATLIGVITGVASDSWIAGLATGGGSFAFLVTFLLIVYFGTERYYLN